MHHHMHDKWMDAGTFSYMVGIIIIIMPTHRHTWLDWVHVPCDDDPLGGWTNKGTGIENVLEVGCDVIIDIEVSKFSKSCLHS